MPYRHLERGLGLLGGGWRYTPRRDNVPCRPLERRLSLLGVGGRLTLKRDVSPPLGETMCPAGPWNAG